MLAADKDVSYSLNKIADSLRNDSAVFHSPSEVMLYDLLQQQQQAQPWTVNLQSWDTWAVGGTYILIILLVISTYRIHRHLEVIYADTIGAMRTLPKVDAFRLRTTGATTPAIQLPTPTATLMTNSSFFVIEMFRDIRHFDTFTRYFEFRGRRPNEINKDK